jgi:UPF0755 protein
MENNLFKNIAPLKDKDFSKISIKFLEKVTSIIGIIFLLVFLYVCFEIYIPINPGSNATVAFNVQKGWSDDDIAGNLQMLGLIKSSYFFKFYSILSLKHSQLQAGKYSLSSKMSIYDIANKIANGDVIKDKIVIFEGWDIKDIGKYLESRDICPQDSFIYLTKKDYSSKFDFLQDKPKNVDLEGYFFPDSYEITEGESCEDVVNIMLDNFGQKFTPALRVEIKNQKKSIFDIVTMASMIEKEVRTLDDKKIVSGILWKRLSINMPLQLDSTIVYITGSANILAKDKTINSPYNTYKYYGLPKGPISNPGIDSITAAIYPTQTKYWYYLTDGKTIFSETLDQHNAAKAKYLY